MKSRFDKVYLEITNACNLACSFCGLTSRPRAFMAEKDFSLILERLEGFTKTLYFHLMGEPLLHPELPRFLDLAGERGFRVNLTTNGTLFPERAQSLSGKSALARINLSLQSLEQFPEGERLERQERLLRTVRDFLPIQRECREDFLVSFRLWTRNDGDFSDPLLAALLGHFLPLAEPRAAAAQILSGRNGFTLAPGVGLHAADSFEWPRISPGTAQDPAPEGFCRGLRDQLGLLVDGTAVPCCLDRNGDIPLGNILEEELREILSTPRAKALYEGFSARKALEPLCRGCSYRSRFSSRKPPSREVPS